jgi:outer membrane lipoprotein-sorting protein
MKYLLFFITVFFATSLMAQQEEALLKQVRAKMDKVNDYTAEGKLTLDVSFINAPPSNITVYYKKPNRFKIKKNDGISILPKGGVSVNVASLLTGGSYQTVPGGASTVDGIPTTVVKLIPTGENSDVVLSVLYIDEKAAVIRKAVVTTKENGTYEILMNYGAYTAWALPDKVVFRFNTKDFKLPKGITFEYDKGGAKKSSPSSKNNKGEVEIAYTKYVINKGVDEKNFQ